MICSHHLQKVWLPSGISVYCSSLDRNQSIADPDFGLYLDFAWRPSWRNEFIDWPDFQTPTNEAVAFKQITGLYQLARSRYTVEIGCVGGHGRTGTVLACLVLLDDKSKDAISAVSFARNAYCDRAIESYQQEWFVARFAEAVR